MPALKTTATLVGAGILLSATRRRSRGGRTLPTSQAPARVALGPFRRDLSLDGYPIHGPGYYWTLSKDTEAVVIYVPIADDVKAKDVIFDCHDTSLKLGLVPEKGGLVINDKLPYKVDVNNSYFILDEGEFGERCISVWLEKLTKEQDWYAYDRFDPVTERFLTEGERERAAPKTKITHKTFFDVTIGGKAAGRIVIGLWGDLVPRTAENFRCLCTGEKGKSEETGEPLHYKGTAFHRIIKGFCVQGGETFDDGEGSGGESIYGLTFDDECLRVKFNRPGLLAMANGGPDTNGSQFFFLMDRADHLSFKCVGFGEVLQGMDVLKKLEDCGTEDGEVLTEACIADCGELPMEPASSPATPA